ncbi:MAG: cell division protein FtsQ/DivIB [Pseudomonadota bacterium]
MQPVKSDPTGRRRPAPPTGPGLSKATFRWQRDWGRRARRIAIIYLPLAVVALIVWRVAADETLSGALRAEVNRVFEVAMEDPDLAVRKVEVLGGSDELHSRLTDQLGTIVGVPAMALDLRDLRSRIEELGAVRSARVELSTKGTLRVLVSERRPAALWRDPDGNLHVVDKSGVRISTAATRSARPGLILILGDGALDQVSEALRIMRAAPAFQPRLRALVRVGERRWDLVLDRDLRVLLPETGAPDAIARVMALHMGEDQLLERDLKVIDMRVPERPVLRMQDRAVETWKRQQILDDEEGEET